MCQFLRASANLVHAERQMLRLGRSTTYRVADKADSQIRSALVLCDEHGLADISPDVAIMFVDRERDNAEGSDGTIDAVEQEPMPTAKYHGE